MAPSKTHLSPHIVQHIVDCVLFFLLLVLLRDQHELFGIVSNKIQRNQREQGPQPQAKSSMEMLHKIEINSGHDRWKFIIILDFNEVMSYSYHRSITRRTLLSDEASIYSDQTFGRILAFSMVFIFVDFKIYTFGEVMTCVHKEYFQV